MRLLQVSVILFFQAIILFVCYAFSHKIERDAKVCASKTTAEQDYCIIVKLWIIAFTKSYVKVVWPFLHTYRRLLFEENERDLRNKPLQKKLVMSLLAPCSQESVKFWYGLSIYFEKKVTDESERQAKALSILIGGGTTYVVKIATKFSSTWTLAQLKRKVA